VTGSGHDPAGASVRRDVGALLGADAAAIGGVPDFAPSLTPYERLALLCDEGSLQLVRSQVRAPAGADASAALGATGRVGGRRVLCYAADGGIAGAEADTIVRVHELALRARVPVIGFAESFAARPAEGLAALDGAARISAQQVALAGRVPQISVTPGDAGSFGLADFTVRTGTWSPGDFAVRTDLDAIFLVRQLLDFLPQSAWSAPSIAYSSEPEASLAGTARDVALGIVDAESLLEVGASWGPGLLCAFARIEGRPVGIVASRPAWRDGALDAEAAAKGARFVRTCDAFGVPLAVLVDTPGVPPAGEAGAAALLRAFAEATVPRVTVLTGRAFGAAATAMNARAIGADLVLAWPDARLGAAAGAATSAQQAAAAGHVDELIEPSETRGRLAWALSDGARPGRERAFDRGLPF
jgi:acetyl-CoA carboxylase carboxyltransferase component